MSGPISSVGTITPWNEYISKPAVEKPDGEGFGGVLKNALQQVNDLGNDANAQIGSLLQGGNTDVNNVMVAIEKADVAFQLMMQVRNKVVSAYQDIEKMQF